ncbi:MAG: hypothetical protein MUO64_04025, partial [Anaerolineales bacterium]|nr:hypothetical protein [Anaerolineales bacterium]
MLKLITEIMILLTALIGFYKVVRYSKPVAYTSALRATKDSPTTKRLLSYFEPALAFLGVYAAILVPMVFMIGFIWLMGGTTSLLGRLSHPKADMTINLPQLGSENGPNYWAWQTARVVSSPGDREKLLTAVVQAAIQNSQYAVALGAARDMPYPGVRDGNLVQVATSAAASGDAA